MQKELGYLYPYHQAIGFIYGEQGAVPNRSCALESLDRTTTFSCTWNEKTKFDPQRRLHYPSELP